MRTSKKYSFKESIFVLAQFFVSKLSLWYFRNIDQRKITFVRKQGIGDVIFTSGILKAFSDKYSKTSIKLVVPFPELIEMKSQTNYSWRDFPVVWLMYEHYDFKFLKGNDQHITKVISQHLGIGPEDSHKYKIDIDDSRHQKFKENYIDPITRYIVIQPWASHWDKNKNWSKENWDDTVAKIEGQFPIYQIGTDSEPLIEGAIDLRGRTLQESILLIKYATLFMGINSFGEQAAAAFDVDSIILYGPTNPVYSLNENQIALFGENTRARSELPQDYDFDSVDSISVDRVVTVVKELLISKT